MKIIKNKIVALFAAGLMLMSCGEDSLDPTQATFSTTDDIVTVGDLSATLNGAYDRMTQLEYYGRNYQVFGEVLSDNAFANGSSGRFVAVDELVVTENNGDVEDLWTRAYGTIAVANLALSVELAEDEQGDLYNHLKGEAYAIRALSHFDLVRYFGQQNVTGGESAKGIPYVTIFRPEGEDLLPSRPSVAENKASIYADLQAAYDMMQNSSDRENAYINKYAVKALEARVANYFGDDQIAKDAAEMVINSGDFEIVSASNYVSSWGAPDSPNWLFKLVNTEGDNLGINGLSQIYQNTGYGDAEVYADVTNLFSDTDVRGEGETIIDPDTQELIPDPNSPGRIMYNIEGLRNYGKYPDTNPADYNIPIIRFEEVVLIYAEALYNLGDASALTWLNKIPQARGANDYSTINIDNILLERRKEFIFEGFRFHDLARTGRAIPIINQYDNSSVPYGDYRFAFPIPALELNANSAMEQNQGY